MNIIISDWRWEKIRREKTDRRSPAHTTGLDFSNSTLYPYNAVPAATKTLNQPKARRTSVWTWICLNKSGLERYWDAKMKRMSGGVNVVDCVIIRVSGHRRKRV